MCILETYRPHIRDFEEHLQPEEGEAQAEAFASSHPGFGVVPPPATFGTLGITTTTGALRTHPGHLAGEGGMDGFYAICWQSLKDF